MRSEAQKKARSNYQKKVTRITVDFYPTEADLVKHLNQQEKKTTYIKNLIREDTQKLISDDMPIIKALEIHVNRGECKECPYAELPIGRCEDQLFKDILELIKKEES